MFRGFRPSSARLRELSKCMSRRASRRPVTVALGIRPETWFGPGSLNQATAMPTGYGSFQRGAGTPGQAAEVFQQAHQGQVRRTQQVSSPGWPRAS